MRLDRRPLSPASTEEGFVLIMALIMLIVLSLLGVASLNTATYEIQIARVEKEYQRQFFFSDAAVNSMLGEGKEPKESSLPAAFSVPVDGSGDPVDPVTCDNLQGMSPFVSYDVDNSSSTPDVDLYYLKRIGSDPLKVRVLSCAEWSSTLVGIIAGVEFGGGVVNPGNLTSYHN